MRSHHIARHTGLLVALVTLALALGGCGAKTGLEAPDVADVVDAALDGIVRVRPLRCFPARVHTRVGFTVNLRPDLQDLPSSGYTWTLRRRPDGSRATLSSDGSDVATLRPDVVGEYDVLAEVLAPTADGGSLQCPILVIADRPDPRCPGYALVEPRPVNVPGGDVQVALGSGWGEARTTSAGSVGALLFDDVNARVAAVVIERPVMAASANPAALLAAEALAAEDAIIREFNATPVFVGRAGSTHDGRSLRRSTLRIGTSTVSDPGALRDRSLRALTNLPQPTEPGPVHTRAAAFYADVTTLLRALERRVVIIVAFAPVASFDDPRAPTSIRVADVANATAVADVGSTLEVACHQIFSTRTLKADFLWLVDTSGSMNNDQQRVGDTAGRFFEDLSNAGVDFRVGVLEASTRIDPLPLGGGYHWIAGDAPSGARQMAWEVTSQRYRDDPMDVYRPFGPVPPDLQAEQPVGTAVLAVRTFEANRAAGSTDPNLVLREEAAHVVFFVTDEWVEQNDSVRFFDRSPTDWGRDAATQVQRVSEFFTSRGILPFGLVPMNRAAGCPSRENLPACVILAAGGAYIPINVRNDAEVSAAFASAMNRVVEAVAGTASEFTLPVVPLSETLRARVDGRIAPRSRADGFDYDDRTRALVFRGISFRPRPGQDVRAAYFLWRSAGGP